ncbi:YbjN domain-containing protein [Micromonospora sp. DR5-3]|uniref:YbjN domain-containing protein n=1 Tax=unclassified Micromonospora TaxID=2617518 RepID=UPI0011D7D7C6|nr:MULTISPECIES: YbjN domain-containing protein [unclassified Micromonospora]MCW3813414.1 YbjN domain-containing protein [Micromonospora sp. DR5-3]TYC24913.1 YbjN domain-containing protein [Micromonospora sp. MP36]
MTTFRDRGLADALADARDLPDGEARCAELDRIAARADAIGDPRTALAARFALMEAYLQLGERWRLVEPVRRCLAALDRTPGLLAGRPGDAERLHRHQRQAVEALFATPRIGLDQARSLLDDLADRLGPDAEPVAELRCRLADHLGDEPTARREYARWHDDREPERAYDHSGSTSPTPRRDPEWSAAADPVAGCPGCAPARRAELLAGWGEPVAALAALRPVLDGEVGCTDQPERALAVALLPWLHTGDAARAARAHVRAYRRHRRERGAFPLLAAHLRFCALGGHLAHGLDILAEQLPRLDRTADDLAAMEFAAAGALLCGLAVEAGLGGRRLHRPGHGPRPAAEVDLTTLGGQLQTLATTLAGSFDARNGTGHQSGRIAAWLAERPLAEPVPLPTEDDAAEWPDDDPAEPGPPGEEEPAPLSLALLTAALDVRGDGYAVEPDGTVVGRWGEAVIEFRRLGRRGEILHARVVATRRLPAARRAEAYAFCNAWNHDRLLPAAYVHDPGDGTVALAADVTTDLTHGVAPAQLVVLVAAAVSTGAAYAEAVAALP